MTFPKAIISILFSILLLVFSGAPPARWQTGHGDFGVNSRVIPATHKPNRRQIPTEQTCGYLTGNPTLSRTAGIGWACRFDTANGLWGFCPQTVSAARDCGLAGYCVDKDACTGGCGRLSDMSDITTFTCQSEELCSTALLVNGPDQTYEYIACGQTATVQVLLPNPTLAQITSPTQASSGTSASEFIIKSSMPSVTPTLSTPDVNAGSPSTTSPNPTSVYSNQANTGVIVGGVVGSIVVICVTVFGIYWIRQRRETRRDAVALPGIAPQTEYQDIPNEIGSSDRPKLMHTQYDNFHAPLEMNRLGQISIKPIELPVNNLK